MVRSNRRMIHIVRKCFMTFFETHHQRKSDGSEYRTRKWGTGFTWVLLLILLIFASWLSLDIATPLSLLRIFVRLASSI